MFKIRSLQKLITGAFVLVTLTTGLQAVAATDKWEWKTYQVETFPPYAKWVQLYHNDQATDVIYKDGEAQPSWKSEGFEQERPYRYFEYLYLDSKKTDVWRYTGETNNGVTEQYAKVFWELKHPYQVKEQLHANIGNKWIPQREWRYTEENAAVTENWKFYGFDYLWFRGDKVVANGEDNNSIPVDKYNLVNFSSVVSEMPANRLSNYNPLEDDTSDTLKWQWDNFVKNLKGENLDLFYLGQNKTANSFFDNRISQFTSQYLTGPDYQNGGNIEVDTMLELVQKRDVNLFNDTLIKNEGFAKVGWKYAGYEVSEPYRIYEVLTVNGVEMDGRIFKCDSCKTTGEVCEHCIKLPNIIRYHGTANPRVEWRTESFEKDWPHEYYQAKYVYDEAGKDWVKTDKIRYTGQFAKPEIKIVSRIVDGATLKTLYGGTLTANGAYPLTRTEDGYNTDKYPDVRAPYDKYLVIDDIQIGGTSLSGVLTASKKYTKTGLMPIKVAINDDIVEVTELPAAIRWNNDSQGGSPSLTFINYNDVAAYYSNLMKSADANASTGKAAYQVPTTGEPANFNDEHKADKTNR